MSSKSITATQYAAALQRIHVGISLREWAFLHAHYRSPDHTATALDLALAVGFRNFRTTNYLYGRLAGKLEAAFKTTLPRSHWGIGVMVIAKGKSVIGHIRLEMRPQLVGALETLGWTGSAKPYDSSPALALAPSRTEVEALRTSRIGQGLFRSGVAAYWKGCAVTKCHAVQLLNASHIKPWRAATNQERLDPYNGLLLTPNLHLAFDLGLISFDDHGAILLSLSASPAALRALGIHVRHRIERLSPKHRKFMVYHRKYVFTKKEIRGEPRLITNS